MKKTTFLIITVILLSFCSESFALNHGNWRWRNDDGDEINATWKSAENTTTTVGTENIRLRMDVYNSFTNTQLFTPVFQYSTSPTGPWTDITTNSANHFMMSDTPNFTDGDATTNIPGLNNNQSNVAGGKLYDQTGSFPLTPNTLSSYEIEMCFKATANAVDAQIYYFQFGGLWGSPAPAISLTFENANALSFDGVNDYVTTGGSLVNVTTDMTIEAWFNTTNATGYNSIATMEPNNPSADNFFQLLTTSTGEVYLKDANNSPIILSPLSYNDGNWHHVAFVRNSVAQEVSLYIDAIFIASETYTVSATFNPDTELRFGNSEYLGGSYQLDGMLDEIRVWSETRTQCELQQAMNTELVGDETGLVAYYNFNQGIAEGNNPTETTLIDGTSNSLDGTLTSFDLTGSTSNWVTSTVSLNGVGNFSDNIAPVADLATLPDVTEFCSVSLSAPTATDVCEGTITGTTTTIFPITTQGTTLVTWTHDDGNDNTSTQTQNVVITDATAPVADIETLLDVTAVCEVISLTAPTAADNCAGTVTVTNDAILPITAQGTTLVTWTYDDGNDNTSIQTQNVVITDATSPVADIETLLDVTAECEVTSLTAPTATDNCAGTVTVTNDATLPITAQGTTLVTWTYDDGNDNTSTQTQNVVITDVTLPAIICANDAVVNLTDGQSVYTVLENELTLVEEDDNCEIATVSNDFNNSFSLEGADFPIGITNVIWNIVDVAGNSATSSMTVTVNAFVGISNISKFGVNVYPNPTSSIVNVVFSSKIGNAEIQILDVTGRVLNTLNVESTKTVIDINEYTDGIYFIRVINENQSGLYKVVKQ